MRLHLWLPLLLVGGTCQAWDTQPHQLITKAALDSLPKRFLSRLGPECQPLIELYCIFPDRYEEMARFGFVRRAPGPRSVSEIERYCIRPDGQPIHSATGDREIDTASLVHVLERILSNLSDGHTGEAARYAGVLSHFVADSLSPPHSVSADRGPQLTARLHGEIERSLPAIALEGRVPRAAGAHLVPAAEAILARLYAGAEQNRSDLAAMIRAASAHDEQALNRYRHRAGQTAAEILADALFTVFKLAEPGP